MVKQIYFNEKYSYDDFGLLLVESPTISLSYENIESINVPGRSGKLTKRLGTYSDKIIKLKFKLINVDEYLYEDTLINLIDWLNNLKDNSLVLNESEYEYRVKYIEVGDIQRQLDWYGDFEVIFICDPFKYKTYENQRMKITEPKNIYYWGNVSSNPIITIYGQGDISITLGDDSFSIKDLEDYITIDSEKLMCYKNNDGVYENRNKDMNGQYPCMKQGTNNINWTGNVSNIEITYDTKYL